MEVPESRTYKRVIDVLAVKRHAFYLSSPQNYSGKPTLLKRVTTEWRRYPSASTSNSSRGAG
jgi:hypothetical protein